ncbi:hypothetical protein SAMN06265346_10636 [Flavobacterium hercynium]|uniref:Uncharacterized protein n=1 Tax=Flavobacterium hercynium TaxID=387094 RepID=A0A226GYY5_9FLAO|nr:hypothetical protein B0A66_16775 [Flavobacterium hercynium]SMP19500.1 hypothetical protein SAMN06265346_10636 [Flavobacterium hercynium]
MRKIFLVTLILIFHLSCSGTKSTTAQWVGKPKQDLVKSWGPPVRTIENYKDGEVLIYGDQIYTNSGNGSSNNTGIAGSNHWDLTYVYVGKDGQVNAIKTEKDQSPPQEVDIKKLVGINL